MGRTVPDTQTIFGYWHDAESEVDARTMPSVLARDRVDASSATRASLVPKLKVAPS
jgi:hypothetical protein